MSVPSEVIAHYNAGREAARVVSGPGRLELWRTQDILLRHLPSPPASVLDVGGGTGVYASWLTGLGYRVHVVDPVPLHVRAAAALPGVSADVGDARGLVEPDSSYDAVLALGPLYHLIERSDRVLALAEFARVGRPGGLVAVAAISRYASTHDGYLEDRLHDPRFAAMAEADAATGVHRNDDNEPGWFTTAYFHHPDELAAEVTDAGLVLDSVLAVEGAAWLTPGLEVVLDDPARRQVMMRWLRSLERERSLLGASSHLLAPARVGP